MGFFDFANFGGQQMTPNLSADTFAAFDAANLASQGIGEGQMGQILGQAGAPDAGFLAADAANLAGQGLSQGAIEQNLGATMPTDSTGGGFMDKLKAGFGGEDAKKLAKDLSGLNKQENKMSPVNTQASGAGGGQLPNYYAGLMGAQQPSGAMQAIQGSMPQMQQPMGIMGRI